jgi:hypothetical protein
MLFFFTYHEIHIFLFFQMDLPDSDSDGDDLDGGLTESEVRELTVGLNEVLHDLLSFFLENFSLKRSSGSLERTVQHLVDLTHTETREFLLLLLLWTAAGLAQWSGL